MDLPTVIINLEGRGTNTVIALAHDVISYCNYNNSPVFVCNLDIEGAFDGLPNPILFMKVIDVIPDMCWKLLLDWYDRINVRVKCNGLHVGKLIPVCKGTRQGWLTSPLIFNVF